jgi:two-component system nitrate/nitrite response regulator NarL
VNQRAPDPVLDAGPLRVMVLDEHTAARREFVTLLANQPGIAVIADAADMSEAQERAPQAEPDVVLMSAGLAAKTDPLGIGALRATWPAAELLMLSASEDTAAVAAAMRAGATGYVLRGLDAELLAASLRRIGRNGKGEGTSAPTGAERGSSATALSPREREILRLVSEGWSNKEIARTLGVAESTVKVHVQHILRKLKLTSRVQAAVYAAGNGFTDKR